MNDSIRQALLAGLNLAGASAEKVAELAKDIAKDVQMTGEEFDEFQADLEKKAKEMQDDLKKQVDEQLDHAFVQIGILKAGAKRASEDAKSTFEQMVEDQFEELIDSLGLARRSEVEALEKRIELLEAKFSDPHNN